MSDGALLSGISGLSFNSVLRISSLLFLPCLLALSVFSSFLLMVHSPDFFVFQKCLQRFSLTNVFCGFSELDFLLLLYLLCLVL